jgi:hypothetical protein
MWPACNKSNVEQVKATGLPTISSGNTNIIIILVSILKLMHQSQLSIEYENLATNT